MTSAASQSENHALPLYEAWEEAEAQKLAASENLYEAENLAKAEKLYEAWDEAEELMAAERQHERAERTAVAMQAAASEGRWQDALGMCDEVSVAHVASADKRYAGFTVLHQLAQKGKCLPIRIYAGFCMHAKAAGTLDKPTADNRKVPALHFAAAIGNEPMVQELLSAGAFVNSFRADKMWTPMDAAAQSGNLACMRLLKRWKGRCNTPRPDAEEKKRRKQAWDQRKQAAKHQHWDQGEPGQPARGFQ